MDGLHALNAHHLIAAARQEIVRDGNKAKVMKGSRPLTFHYGGSEDGRALMESAPELGR